MNVSNMKGNNPFKVVAFLLLLLPTYSFGATKAKEAILLVAFGTTSKAGTKAYQNIEATIKRALPDHLIEWAYTSEIVRERLYTKYGKKVQSVSEALTSLQEAGYQSISVQSLHVVAGAEFEQLNREIRQYEAVHPKAFSGISIGRPLLDSKADMEAVAQAVIDDLKKKQKHDEGLILLGHGHHDGLADLSYIAMAHELNRLNPNIFLSTVEGGLPLDESYRALKMSKVKTVWLAPFMVVAGVHTKEDLIGDAESVKADLLAAGYSCKEHIKGLGEYDAIANLFLSHLKKAMVQ